MSDAADSILGDMSRRAQLAALTLYPAFPGYGQAAAEASATYTTDSGLVALRAVFDGYTAATSLTLTPPGKPEVGIGYGTAARLIRERLARIAACQPVPPVSSPVQVTSGPRPVQSKG